MLKKVALFIGAAFLLGGGIIAASSSDSSSQTSTKIIIDTRYSPNCSQYTEKQKYAKAYKVEGTALLAATLPNSSIKLLTCDSEITVEAGTDGLTLTNTSNTASKCFQIGRLAEAGCFDFSSLRGRSGKIGIDFRVDVNGNNGGFTFLRAYNSTYSSSSEATSRVAPEQYVKNGTVLKQGMLGTYINKPVDNVYFKLTLPKGGVMKIYAMYIYMETVVTGFADMEEKITGGAGATAERTYTVADAAGLNTALKAIKAEPAVPALIYLNGTITYADWKAITKLKQRYIDIGAEVTNLSIIGIGTSGILDGVGLKICGANTLIQNITVRYVEAGDGIQINGAQYTKVDHCSLYNQAMTENSDREKYDELLSAKNSAQYVVVSWCKFYDSWKTILVGSNDSTEALPDRKMIFHHNWFRDCSSRLPLYRGGFAHLYNNYFQNVDSSCINCRTGSKVRIESNCFENCANPIGFWYDTSNPAGGWDVRNNRFENCSGEAVRTSTCLVRFESSYHYKVSGLDSVKTMIQNGAGVGKIAQ